jgi:hypothetical protein
MTREYCCATFTPDREVYHVFVECFGSEDSTLTVFNDSSESQTVTLHFDTDLPQHGTNTE